MPKAPIEEPVQYMGETYIAELRPVTGGYQWALRCPEGCPLTSRTRNEPVNRAAALNQARGYLKRTWPYGRANPFGESETARRVRILGRQYVLLLRSAPFGRFNWALYTVDGITSIIGADTVAGIDSAERLARAFKGET